MIKIAQFGKVIVALSLSAPALAQPFIDLGTVQVSSLGHVFSPENAAGGPTVQDFFIDQQQTFGGGGVLSSVSANLDSNYYFSITITAPPGKKFHVHVPPSSQVKFGGDFQWASPDGFFSYVSRPITASFGSLDGLAPSFGNSSARIALNHAAFGFSLNSSYITSDIYFASITLTGSVTNNGTPVGTRTYNPSTNSLNQFYAIYFPPFGQTNDPGPFVSIIPVPTLRIARSSSAVAVSWPTTFSSWVLEATTNLRPGNVWSVVTNSRVTVGTNKFVTNTISQQSRFYRMRSQ